MVHVELWKWENCGEKIRTLRGRLGFPDEPVLRFLGLKLSLEDGRIYDEIRQKYYRYVEPIYCILSGYADASPVEESGQLISFSKLPGGAQYYSVFMQRTAKPIEKTFCTQPRLLIESARLIGGKQLSYGDYSVKIYSLPLVPIVIVLWEGEEDLPPSVNILYDSTITNYLTTEQTVLLSELTSLRLKHALKKIRSRT